MPPSNDLDTWTIHWNPADYPGRFVARLWVVSKGEAIPTKTSHVALSLEAIRQTLPQGLHRLERSPKDDPVIVETWL